MGALLSTAWQAVAGTPDLPDVVLVPPLFKPAGVSGRSLCVRRGSAALALRSRCARSVLRLRSRCACALHCRAATLCNTCAPASPRRVAWRVPRSLRGRARET
jgi:hypothetical protein